VLHGEGKSGEALQLMQAAVDLDECIETPHVSAAPAARPLRRGPGRGAPRRHGDREAILRRGHERATKRDGNDALRHRRADSCRLCAGDRGNPARSPSPPGPLTESRTTSEARGGDPEGPMPRNGASRPRPGRVRSRAARTSPSVIPSITA
jgi:hypothetical protein